MAKKAQRPMARGTRTSKYPNPSYYGLTDSWWKKVEKFTSELNELHERTRKERARRNELQSELDFQKSQHRQAVIKAARYGDEEPDAGYIQSTKKALDKQDARLEAIGKALEQADLEFQQFLREDPPADVLNDLYDKGKEHEGKYLYLIAQAQQERARLGEQYALYQWARNARDYNSLGMYRNNFRPTPLGGPNQQAWYELPLQWGRISDTPEATEQERRQAERDAEDEAIRESRREQAERMRGKR